MKKKPKLEEAKFVKTIINFNHLNGKKLFDNSCDIDSMKIADVINRIVNINSGIQKFWSSPKGWAPLKVANLLSKSRLDRQVLLSKTLSLYVNVDSKHLHDGYLILGWTNLGALVEGALKLFLSVYYEGYSFNVKKKIQTKKVKYPEGLRLDSLRMCFVDGIWDDDFDKIIKLIQRRRNAIHSFQDKNIGDFDEFSDYVRKYLKLLRYFNFRMPYPDDVFIPKENGNDTFIIDQIEILKERSEGVVCIE